MKRFLSTAVVVFFSTVFFISGCGLTKPAMQVQTFENKNLSLNYPLGWVADESIVNSNEKVEVHLEKSTLGVVETSIEIKIRKNYIYPDLPGIPGAQSANEQIAGVDFVTLAYEDEELKTEIKEFFGYKDTNSIIIKIIGNNISKNVVDIVLGSLRIK